MSAENRHNLKKLSKVALDRRNADQGDFFFGKIMLQGNLCSRPVFVVGKHGDSNDTKDVIICIGTTQPQKSDYDIPVQLREKTYIRTNKIYTIGRHQLEFKIKHSVNPVDIHTICENVEKAIRFRQ
ncbi:PemK-like, MazF-like toxin of type II toxin-antitoxin system [Fictibacillus enclensis]|uniref:Uncharacterized protein n=1 Tax=Fictibacillus enclensis TaxID=1017270 RepID=A0A0V8J8T4_9BACL|nr:type II toxin-antitoxin system PemK/MazF family toxin [Fictibacillus enclensis]KSU83427.1 hypothetical protein AS030_12745 [Fictibacillus enclensis]SCC15278.1 PemK-like, MazF-like toxin of type II toxin-antitoxin system [Fictibacillus enclensis]